MQIKIKVWYYLSSLRLALIKSIDHSQWGWGSSKTDMLLHCWCEYKMLQPLGRWLDCNYTYQNKNIKTFWLLQTHTNKIYIAQRCMHVNWIIVFLIKKKRKMPTSRGVSKLIMAHTYFGILCNSYKENKLYVYRHTSEILQTRFQTTAIKRVSQ